MWTRDLEAPGLEPEGKPAEAVLPCIVHSWVELGTSSSAPGWSLSEL
jgi:hypothetical protein